MFNQKLFSKTLRDIRTARKHSLNDVALSVGRVKSAVYNIERGETKPDVDTFFALCAYMGITPNAFEVGVVADNTSDVLPFE